MTRTPLNQRFFLLVSGLLLSAAPWQAAWSQTVPGCGTLSSQGQYGPYDARTDLDKLPIVMGAHFTPAIEALIPGTTTSLLGGDIDYTLRAVPNYPRALLSMMRLAQKEKSDPARGAHFPVECYFQRAIVFRPDDSIVRMIYSTYLNSKGRVQEANTQLEAATVGAKDKAFTHYNIGLHYFELKNYAKALVQAHKAMELGWTQPELRAQLQSVGKWVEPEDMPKEAPADKPADKAPDDKKE